MGLHCSAAGPKYQPQDVSSHEQSDSYSTEPIFSAVSTGQKDMELLHCTSSIFVGQAGDGAS